MLMTGMDNIMKRPHAPPEATKNWSPFALNYHRIIVAVDTTSKMIQVRNESYPWK